MPDRETIFRLERVERSQAELDRFTRTALEGFGIVENEKHERLRKELIKLLEDHYMTADQIRIAMAEHDVERERHGREWIALYIVGILAAFSSVASVIHYLIEAFHG